MKKFFVTLCFLLQVMPALSSQIMVDEIVQLACENTAVILAELPSHGEALTFKTKADVSMRLVETCGFEAIMFEAPFYEFIELNRVINEGGVELKHLEDALGRFWLSNELAPWRLWLFEQAKKQKLKLMGLDDQISITSHLSRAQITKLFQRYIPDSQLAQCQEVLKRDLFWQYNEKHPFSQDAQGEVLRCVQLAQSVLEKTASDKITLATERQVLDNLENLYLRLTESPVAKSRDHIMFINQQRQHEKTKHIIWTSTVHATKQAFHSNQQTLGSYLYQQLDEQLTVIGFTAHSGYSSMAGMSPQELKPAPAEALESAVLDAGIGAIVLDTDALKKFHMKLARLHGPFTAENWHELYDAVVVFKAEKAPVFE